MLRRQLLRKPWSFTSSFNRTFPSNRPVSDHAARTRLEKILQYMPRSMKQYTNKLRNAPVSHIVAFLILHEVTAIVPVVGLAYYFHQSKWLPVEWSEGSLIASEIKKYDRYFRKKRWFGLSEDSEDELSNRIKHSGSRDLDSSTSWGKAAPDDRLEDVPGGSAPWEFTSGGTRVVVEVATAYVITKALLLPRIAVSLWLTPLFARTVVAGIAGVLVRSQTKFNHTFLKKKGPK